MSKKTCFVIIGYETKTDPFTGRELNLENSYKSIIKPVFDEIEMECFRVKDILYSGVIDSEMYNWIYKADIVLADISTLNPNVMYELGVRHALRPFTTIIIAEDGIVKEKSIPFDLSHLNIDPLYHHLGEDIGTQEAIRFKKKLKLKVQEILKKSDYDSPVYTFINDLNPPSLTKKDIAKIKEHEKISETIPQLHEEAEHYKNKTMYGKSEKLLRKAYKMKKDNAFTIQRLALITYKNEKPSKEEAYEKAYSILERIDPENTTDTETLGLAGAINKRLFETKKKKSYLEKAIWFYERGFYIKQDYYNAINVAYLYTLKSTLTNNKDEAITDYNHANRIRKKTLEICEKIIKDKHFTERNDRNWVYFTMAEIYVGLGNMSKMNQMIESAKKYSEGDFALQSFNDQKEKLKKLIDKYQKKWGN